MHREASKKNDEPLPENAQVILSEDSFLKVTFEQPTKIVICKWAPIQTLDSIKASGDVILQEFSRKKATKVLNDNSDVQKHWEYAVDWTTGYWFPAMATAGLKHFAWVLSKDIFARVSAKRAGQQFQVVRFFRSYRYAHDWLSNLPEQR